MNMYAQPTGPRQPIEVVAFDCDGVLFDSREANIRYYNHILGRTGAPPVKPEQREYIHMHPVRESLRYLLGDGELFRQAFNYSGTIDFKEFNACLSCEPGLVDILRLAKSFFKIALATNRTVSTREVLVHFDLDRYFDLVVSASDVPRPKPHPDEMDRIAETFGVLHEQILYVGDSTVDEKLAEATGVYFVAYKNPELKAHLHIAHFQELVPLLEAQAKNRTR